MNTPCWTEKHIVMDHEHRWVAYDEAGQILDIFDTKEDATEALLAYGEWLEAYQNDCEQFDGAEQLVTYDDITICGQDVLFRLLYIMDDRRRAQVIYRYLRKLGGRPDLAHTYQVQIDVLHNELCEGRR